MKKEQTVYRDILLPIDLENHRTWEHALPKAVQYCEAFDARLHILAVVPDYGMSLVGQFFPPRYEKKRLQETNKKLHDFVDKHVPDTIVVQHIIAQGGISDAILEIADETNVDLIIMAARQPELKDYILGPNASRVLRYAKQSVLVVKSLKKKKLGKA
jgi:nucleotide-binding universal stress UspA family protein